MVEHIVEVRAALGDVCDFCSSEDPRYVEAAADFDTQLGEGVPAHSQSGWSSCEECHQLIGRKQWHALERRATDALAAKHPELPRSRIAAGVRHMHLEFRTHRRSE